MPVYQSKNNPYRILFICTGNSCRSQMAEGLARSSGCKAYSAGVFPSQVNPRSITVMAELGIDISQHVSNAVTDFVNDQFDMVITLGETARKHLPHFTGIVKEFIHHPVYDPYNTSGTDDEVLPVYRRVRDELKEWIDGLCASDDLNPSSPDCR